MQITRHTDYALRLLMYLALRHERATVGEAAESLGVSRHHLVKVATRLGALGCIEVIRGRGGGIRLARPPESIIIGQVFRALENCVLVECFDDAHDTCVLSGPCALNGVFRKAFAAFCDELDQVNLSELVTHDEPLRTVLGLAPPHP